MSVLTLKHETALTGMGQNGGSRVSPFKLEGLFFEDNGAQVSATNLNSDRRVIVRVDDLSAREPGITIYDRRRLETGGQDQIAVGGIRAVLGYLAEQHGLHGGVLSADSNITRDELPSGIPGLQENPLDPVAIPEASENDSYLAKVIKEQSRVVPSARSHLSLVERTVAYTPQVEYASHKAA